MLRNENLLDPYYILPNGRPSKTMFYQGVACSQTQISKYIGENFIPMTTGDYVICRGRNNLKPINILFNPFIGAESKDVNLRPFDSFTSQFNPVKLVSASVSMAVNWYQGIEIYDAKTQYRITGSKSVHSINISELSLAQETDIASHFEKYQLCKEPDPDVDIVAFGVSKGAATTFVSLAKKHAEGHYSEVKLAVLEGCFRSVEDTFFFKALPPAWSIFNTGLSLFTKYQKDGPSPGNCVADFPENIPVVFITSEKDRVVPSWSTELLANDLAARGKNDVYLLKLKNSSHPNYMFDDPEDRDTYEAFIHAIYKRYKLPYIPTFAEKGEALLDKCLLPNRAGVRKTFGPSG